MSTEKHSGKNSKTGFPQSVSKRLPKNEVYKYLSQDMYYTDGTHVGEVTWRVFNEDTKPTTITAEVIDTAGTTTPYSGTLPSDEAYQYIAPTDFILRDGKLHHLYLRSAAVDAQDIVLLCDAWPIPQIKPANMPQGQPKIPEADVAKYLYKGCYYEFDRVIHRVIELTPPTATMTITFLSNRQLIGNMSSQEAQSLAVPGDFLYGSNRLLTVITGKNLTKLGTEYMASLNTRMISYGLTPAKSE